MKFQEADLYYEEELSGELGDLSGASSDEVLAICMDRLGCVDMMAMSHSSGKSCEQLAHDLKNAILQDPAEFEYEEHWSIDKGWLDKVTYCSGNIRKKLEIAEQMNQRFYGRFENNVLTLKKILPPALTMKDIRISLGTPLPEERLHIYGDFIKGLLKLSRRPSVQFNKELHIWQVKAASKDAASSILNRSVYGTVEMSAIQIIEHMMNARTIVVEYPQNDRAIKGTINKDATCAVQEREKLIAYEFEKWVTADTNRCKAIEEYYNDTFVGYYADVYDGSFLQFPGLNPAVTFYEHQRNAIAKWLLSKQNLLLAHSVGAGKTYVICAGVHEQYRMGLSKKNLVIVPNNRLESTVADHKYLYPDDKILAVYPKDFNHSVAERCKILEQIRDGDYVAVYMAASSFDMIVMSKAYWDDKMCREINAIHRAINTVRHKREKGLLERRKTHLNKTLAEYRKNAADTPWLTFEQLGIETLVVDEAHNYKNIPMKTRTTNIVGMHSKGSDKCKEMLEKTRVVNKVVFATGTPITNSLSDVFALQTYLQPEELEFRNISSFDMWINTFGERETNFEVDVDGHHLRLMTRFSNFHNLPELMAMFSSVSDFYQVDESGDDMPKFNGYRNICVPKSPMQAEYILNLVCRTEAIRGRKVKNTEDNLLKVTMDGSKCGLHYGLVDPAVAAKDTGDNKVKACARKVLELYEKYPDTCQAVICDLGTPKSSFNVYDCLKNELVAKGIPAYEIAFVHDATTEEKRLRMFEGMNAGRIRVAIGSTAKLGIGVNIQEKLVALHHLSVPWRPSDMVQREGRIRRRGNTCEESFIFRYVTEESFDAYLWQLLENKQRFISSFLSGAFAGRDEQDVADIVLNYAEVKALAIGNPLIRDRVEVANRLERLKLAYRQRQKQLIDLRAVVEGMPSRIRRLKTLCTTIRKDIRLYDREKQEMSNEERIDFGEELLEALRKNHRQPEESWVFNYQGFDVVLPADMDSDHPYIQIRSENGGEYYLEMDTDKPLGCAMRMTNLLRQLPERLEELKQEIQQLTEQVAVAHVDIEKGNPYESDVESLVQRLAEIDKQLESEETKQ